MLEGNVLRDMLCNPTIWESLDIDYHEPRVERVWTQVGDKRLCLHRIHSCEAGKALFHPHPWPSAMKIIDGSYKMGVGTENGGHHVRQAATLILNPGSYYEMSDVHGWHYVAPVTEVAHSIMLIGQPWEKPSRGLADVTKKLEPLSDDKKKEILDHFKSVILK